MSSLVYDYAIIGAGAAGIHVAMAIHNNSWFEDMKILIIDKGNNEADSKTWCFWEKNSGNWDGLVKKSWNSGKFITEKQEIDLELFPYKYKMLDSKVFYKHARNKLEKSSNFHWITAEVNEINENDTIQIKTAENIYHCRHVFDSRIDPAFLRVDDSYIRILQHFKGWFITSEVPAFDSENFIMMDYRLKWKDTTCFTYVLPVNPKQALVEFTFFSPDLVEENVYDQLLEEYIRKFLTLDSYSIDSIEKGVIPMSNFPFHKKNTHRITKIGTAGSWVKPSSGYSFKNAERMAELMINNIINGKNPAKGLISKKFRYYDALFLEVLKSENHLGEELFTSLYTANTIQNLFDFLDEKSALTVDLRIISSLKPIPFIKAFFKRILSL